MYINLLKYSVKNILRNKFLSISSILVLTLLMFFINTLLVLHNLSFKLIDSINSKISISLYLQDDYDKTTNDVVDLINDIKKISPDLSVVYKDKTEVLEDIRKKDSALVRILEQNNPLPNTILIKNIPLAVYDELNRKIESKIYLFSDSKKDKMDKIDDFSDYKSQFKRINSTISVLKTLQF
jgi:cell division protein FtsX